MTAVDVGVLFDALADPTRRRVLDAVAAGGTTTPTALAQVVGVTRQAVTKHLVVLQTAGLVDAERVGREARYRVVPGSLRPVADWAERTDAAWDDRLGRLRRAMAERTAARTSRA
jgi:DNA-binding transcriptional ArsR family regulator